MKILGRPRTWFLVAAVWAALIDLLVVVHHRGGSTAFWAVWLAIPLLVTVAACAWLRPVVGWAATVIYLLIAVLSGGLGIYLGLGMLAMVLGTLLIGAEPMPGE